MRGIARTWGRLRLDWEVGLHRLPFFTQKVAVMLLGALVASLALLGGVVALIGPPGADGPDTLVPGGTGDPPAPTRPAPGRSGGQGGDGGATAPAPVGAPASVPARRASQPGRVPAGPTAATGAAGAAPAAPPTTAASSTTTNGQGGLPPLESVVSSVVSTLLP